MKTKTKKSASAIHQPAPKKVPNAIEWPAQWAADEGWPSAKSDELAPGGRHTWCELDEALKRQGTSIADRIAKMGGK